MQIVQNVQIFYLKIMKLTIQKTILKKKAQMKIR